MLRGWMASVSVISAISSVPVISVVSSVPVISVVSSVPFGISSVASDISSASVVSAVPSVSVIPDISSASSAIPSISAVSDISSAVSAVTGIACAVMDIAAASSSDRHLRSGFGVFFFINGSPFLPLLVLGFSFLLSGQNILLYGTFSIFHSSAPYNRRKNSPL